VGCYVTWTNKKALLKTAVPFGLAAPSLAPMC
jgi:hypothetical protein